MENVNRIFWEAELDGDKRSVKYYQKGDLDTDGNPDYWLARSAADVFGINTAVDTVKIGFDASTNAEVRYWRFGEIDGLDDLQELLNNGLISDDDLDSLPTFGGPDPEAIATIWSWDEDRVLILVNDDWRIESRPVDVVVVWDTEDFNNPGWCAENKANGHYIPLVQDFRPDTERDGELMQEALRVLCLEDHDNKGLVNITVEWPDKDQIRDWQILEGEIADDNDEVLIYFSNGVWVCTRGDDVSILGANEFGQGTDDLTLDDDELIALADLGEVGVTIVRPSLWQIDFDRIGDLDS